ncbi:helix-turn-helix domain-containing protein [Solibaculum mannosilyticum]|uniref:XRE family transcriptional regulator n=1 Tax=Solibaculum mannosilyticum TaxID=2780922 RepID=A0A7I8D4R4_9FIRM|nr:helix-turn-helix domain-containing protein [Solibaculum mannosilyticum]MCO7137962.1 helix-turn-helix domain-containing protein [[Clostridium] leptum]BCI60772.1 XRE family transcriptional regulator [Solibaculum mannosilyticum]
MPYITGKTIRELREKNGLTQKQLADQLCVSDKTVSKWETERGLPDLSIVTDLASALNVSVVELLTGEYINNQNRAGNMNKISFFVCPICGNVIQAVGKGAFSCCGVLLPALETEDDDQSHMIQVQSIDGEYYVYIDHDMTKKHSISFVAYVTSNHVEMIKLYPEQNAEVRFTKRGRGTIYAYCNKHGLYRVRV